jgi:predicted DNA-binding transcriptional regulator AlpA
MVVPSVLTEPAVLSLCILYRATVLKSIGYGVYSADMSTLAAVAVELVGPAELAQLLGVSRTRVVQISSDERFPKPLAELSMGKVWDLAEVRKWADERGRTLLPLAAVPGRAAGHAKATPRAAGASRGPHRARR